jgi:hypothetical protein
MPEPLDDPEHIIAVAIDRHAPGDVVALTRAILDELWDAGYEIRLRPADDW